jgi:BASS family bile acid:Na+ symporter
MNKKSILIFCVIIMGIFFNKGEEYSYLIKYLLMGMLFFPFLSVSFPTDKSIYLNVIVIFIAMVLLSTVTYFLLIAWNVQIATIAFLIAFTPTATAAPVIISFLHKNVDYVILSVVITNCLVALIIPFILPIITPIQEEVSVFNILVSTMMVVLIPLGISQLLIKMSNKLTRNLASTKNIPFVIWLVVLYLATSKTSVYLFSNLSSYTTVLEIAAVSLVICIMNFSFGSYIGGAKYSKEASQSLGQKNTMLMAWIALEYIGPLAVLGPVFYLIYQNIYNSFLLSSKFQE